MWKLLAAALLVGPTTVGAQHLADGTYDVYFQEISAEGRLEGCSLVFTTITTDSAYLGGKQVLLNGSVALRTLGRTDLLFAGKLGTRQLLQAGPGAWERPVHFHFASDSGTTAGAVQIMDGENDGYRLLLGRATEEPILSLVKDITKANQFSVGFNRKTGGQDVTAVVKLNVSLQRSPSGEVRIATNNETAMRYSMCVSRLIDGLSEQLRGK